MIAFVNRFFQAIFTLLAADFVAGIVHWLEDAYVREDTPVVGALVGRQNIVHHHCPRYFTRLNWWQSSWDLLCISAAIVLVAWALNVLTWQVWLFATISVNANEVHKWAHRTRKENGALISFFQDIRLLQTPRHHSRHHTSPKNSHYCTTTNLLNPVLDSIRFWDGLEWLIWRVSGLRRREDTSLPGHGPAPAWLEKFREKNSSGQPVELAGGRSSS